MKRPLAKTLVLLALALAASFPAAARHRSHVGFYFGGPFYDPFWGPGPFIRPYPYFYEPRTVIIEREPPVYIQRQPTAPVAPAAPAQPAQATWYYCPQPAGYYPYIQNCSQQWVSVDPRSVAPPPPQ